MKVILFVFFIVLIVSCKSLYNNTESEDDCYFEAVVFDTNVIINLPDTISITELSGKWQSMSFWIENNLTWTGLKSAEIIYEYEFKENSVFYFRVIKNGKELNCSNQGAYDIEIDSNYLVLLSNQNADTIFRHGEEVELEKIRIYTLNDSTLRLGECYFEDGKAREFVEYRKQ